MPDIARSWLAVAAVAALAAALMLPMLGVPTRAYFDEVYYVKSARLMISLSHPWNIEHPLMAKQMIALGITLFGDHGFGWRILPALCGILAVLAMARIGWALTRKAGVAFMAGLLLLASGMVVPLARIAILDIFMLLFMLVAIALVSEAWRAGLDGRTRFNRLRIAGAGIAIGLSLGSKWTGWPVFLLIGLGFASSRFGAVAGRGGGLRRHLADWLFDRRAGPVAGVSLIEAGLLLGLLPALVYFITYWPILFYQKDAVPLADYVAYQAKVFERQAMRPPPHRYSSVWWQWVFDIRPIWLMFSRENGAFRGVVLLGNPAVMWGGLLALGWSAWAGWRRMDGRLLAIVAAWLLSVGVWIVLPKPVTYYHHYLVPAVFLVLALAFALDRLAATRRGWLVPAFLFVTVAIYGWFIPTQIALPWSGKQQYLFYTWLPTWR